MAYQDVRGPDGRLLFQFDSGRMLIEIIRNGQTYVVDLTVYLATQAAVVEIDPLADIDGTRHLTRNPKLL